MSLQLTRTTSDMLRRMDAHLRTGIAPSAVRAHVRGELGPQAFRHAHYSFDDFFQPDRDKGIVRNVYGQRTLFASGALLASLTATLVELLDGKATETLYRAGMLWGDADFATCTARLEHEYAVPLSDLDIALVLESWWWPRRAGGWGRWRCDLSKRQSGLVVVDVFGSAVAGALGKTGFCECHVYAGLFAGAFGRLTAHQLGGVEIACESRGDACCRFVVADPSKIERARDWRDRGQNGDEILKRLQATGGNS